MHGASCPPAITFFDFQGCRIEFLGKRIFVFDFKVYRLPCLDVNLRRRETVILDCHVDCALGARSRERPQERQ